MKLLWQVDHRLEAGNVNIPMPLARRVGPMPGGFQNGSSTEAAMAHDAPPVHSRATRGHSYDRRFHFSHIGQPFVGLGDCRRRATNGPKHETNAHGTGLFWPARVFAGCALKRAESCPEYNHRDERDDGADCGDHHNVEIAFAVRRSVGGEQCHYRAVVRQAIESAGADHGDAVQEPGTDPLGSRKRHIGVAERIERDRR
jgi:hypothetical protein